MAPSRFLNSFKVFLMSLSTPWIDGHNDLECFDVKLTFKYIEYNTVIIWCCQSIILLNDPTSKKHLIFGIHIKKKTKYTKSTLDKIKKFSLFRVGNIFA